MNNLLSKRIKIIVVMLSLLVTIPLQKISANETDEQREAISSIFTNESTAIGVAMAYKRIIGRPNDHITVDYEISEKELVKIDQVQYSSENPISFVDPELTKLKGMTSLYYGIKEFESFDGIEVLADTLKTLNIGRTNVTSFEPLAKLTKLENFAMSGGTELQNNVISNDPDFLKPLEGLKLTVFHSARVALNDAHTESIAKISTIKNMVLEGANITTLAHISKLSKLETLDVSDNNLYDLKGIDNLVNLRTLLADNVDVGRNKNRIYDYSDLVVPYTRGGTHVKNINFERNMTYLPLSVEYILQDDGEYEPLYYFDLNRIKLPQSSEGYNPVEMDITLQTVGKSVDKENNRIILDTSIVESIILDRETGEPSTFEFYAATMTMYIEGAAGKYMHQGRIFLGVDSLEVVGDLPPSKQVNVEFVYNNDKPNETIQVDINQAMPEPQIPAYGKNKFVGWYSDSSFNTKWDFSNLVVEDMTLYARWEYAIEDKYFTISFDSQGGTQVQNQRVKENNLALQPETPKKAGHTFEGWYMGPDFEALFDFDTLITDDIQLRAEWNRIPVYYNFIFDSMGGSKIDAQKVLENTLPQMPKEPFKEGHAFKGWYVDIDLSDLHDFSALINDHVTVFAKWERVPEMFTVTFDAQNGTVIPKQLVEENSLAILPESPLREGYLFSGWYIDVDNGEQFDFNTPITTNIELIAKWTLINDTQENSYVVEFDTQGGSLIADIRVIENQLITQPESPIKEGYTFIGWYLDLSDTVTFDFNTAITKNMRLIAKWSKIDDSKDITLEVRFNAQGGTLVPTQTLVPGALAIKPEVPVKEGYVFSGWYLDTDFKAEYTFKDSVFEDTVLYAKWVKEAKVLPSTGVSSNSISMVASSLIGIGLLLVVLKRRKEEA